jgi:hypothetical protein
MADVILKGKVNEDGSFEIKLNDVTQKKFFSQVTQGLEKTAKAGDPKLQKLVKDLGDAIKKGGIDDNRELKKILGEMSGKERFAQRQDRLLGSGFSPAGMARGAAGLLLTPLTSALEIVGDSIRTIFKSNVEFGDLSEIAERQVAKLPLIGSTLATAMNMFAGFLDESVTMFRDLSQVGGAFNNSLQELRLTALRSGLTIDEFGNVVRQNATTLAAYRGSVTQGATAFSEITRLLRKDFASQIFELGVSTQELSELTVSALEIFRRNGRLQTMTQGEVVASTAGLIKQFDQLAKLTGKSREESAKNILAAQSETDFRQFLVRDLKNQSPDVRNALTLLVTTLTDALPGFKSGIFNIISAGTATNQFGAELTGVAGGFVNVLQTIRQAAMTGNLNLKDIGTFLKQAQNTLAISQEQFSRLAQLGIQAGGAVGTFIGESARLQDFLQRAFDPEFVDQEQKRREQLNRGLTNINNAFRLLRTEIQYNLLNSKVFDSLADVIGRAVYALNKFAKNDLPGIVTKIIDAVDLFFQDLLTAEGRDRLKVSFDLLVEKMYRTFLTVMDKLPLTNFANEIKQSTDQINQLTAKESELLKRSEIRRNITRLESDKDDDIRMGRGLSVLTNAEKADIDKKIALEQAKLETLISGKSAQSGAMASRLSEGFAGYLNSGQLIRQRKMFPGITQGNQLVQALGRPDTRKPLLNSMNMTQEEFTKAISSPGNLEYLTKAYNLSKDNLQELKRIATIMEQSNKNLNEIKNSNQSMDQKTKRGQMESAYVP